MTDARNTKPAATEVAIIQGVNVKLSLLANSLASFMPLGVVLCRPRGPVDDELPIPLCKKSKEKLLQEHNGELEV